MPDFKRVGPYRIFTDTDECGNLLNCFKILSVDFRLEALGSDNKTHMVQVKMPAPMGTHLYENTWICLEAILRQRMIDTGVWTR